MPGFEKIIVRTRLKLKKGKDLFNILDWQLEILGSKKARLLFSYGNPVLCRSIYRQLEAVLAFPRHYHPGFLHRRDEGRILLYQNLPVLGRNVTPHRLRKTFFTCVKVDLPFVLVSFQLHRQTFVTFADVSSARFFIRRAV